MIKKKWIITVCLLAVSITFIAIGTAREEHMEVFRKAVNICLECIGIG